MPSRPWSKSRCDLTIRLVSLLVFIYIKKRPSHSQRQISPGNNTTGEGKNDVAFFSSNKLFKNVHGNSNQQQTCMLPFLLNVYLVPLDHICYHNF